MKKIRVKSTGAIYIVPDYVTISVEECNSSGSPLFFSLDEIEILDEDNTALSREQGALDYWTRLEHQYAGMAMQGMLSNATVVTALVEGKSTLINTIPRQAKLFAHALVEKMKEERK